MNDKKAKALRKLAREATAEGVPARQLLKNQKTGQIIHDPQSTRGMYRLLKKQAR